MTITSDIKYIGVNDHKVDLFEGQYEVPLGMSYNSYLVLDDKNTVFDTVDAAFGEEWLENLRRELGDKKPDYLVVQHMEPDHASCIDIFAEAYPDAKIVSSLQAFSMMKNFFGDDYADRRIIVKEGDTLSTGHHTFAFVGAPMVHWPEVIVTYDVASKSLFSADGFGKFGALDREDPEGWDCEARRYYIGIVGKFGPQVQALLKKASTLEIDRILPLHGPIHDTPEMIAHVIEKYDIWSSYRVETDGVFIAYTSVYGHTKEAAMTLAKLLKEKGVKKVAIADLARDDMFECVEDAFRYSKLVLATTTYNTGIFPFMNIFIHHLTERNYQNRTVAFIENGSWAPMAAKTMRELLAKSKNLEFVDEVVTVRGALNDVSNAKLNDLACALLS